jgi:anti-anti-sigma factor
MGDPSFVVEVREAGPGVCTLVLRGRLDTRAEAALADAHTLARNREARTVLLDFTDLRTLDGAGLGLLLKLWAWTAQEDQALRAFGLGERCRGVLRELGLSQAIPTYPDPDAAREGRSPGPSRTPGAGCDCPADQWASGLGTVHTEPPPNGFERLNVERRKVQGPLQGFGQLWHKTYRARLAGATVTPAEVTAVFKERLSDLWPAGNRFHLPPPGLVPGAVGFIHLILPGGAPLETGARVLHVDQDSFTLVTLEGHMQAGWITFGAYEDVGCTVAQVQSVGRTGDPLYEVGFRLFGHAQQEHFWRATLEALGQRLGTRVRVESLKSRLDAHVNWGATANLWRNAGVRTGLHVANALVRRAFGSHRA